MIKSFQLGARKFSVEVVDTPHSDALGKAYSDLNKIVMFTKWGDDPRGANIPPSMFEQTLVHEVVHCILEAMGRNDLSSDETFVQGFSLLLHQYQKTAK